jgi:hypothetical protein
MRYYFNNQAVIKQKKSTKILWKQAEYN